MYDRDSIYIWNTFAELSLFNNSYYPEEFHARCMSAHLFVEVVSPWALWLDNPTWLVRNVSRRERGLLSAGHFMSFPVQLWWWDDSWLRMNFFHESQEDFLEAALHCETMVLLVVKLMAKGFIRGMRHLCSALLGHWNPCSACLIQHAAGLEFTKVSFKADDSSSFQTCMQ